LGKINFDDAIPSGLPTRWSGGNLGVMLDLALKPTFGDSKNDYGVYWTSDEHGESASAAFA
jgi:hypothetical protein